MKAEDFECMLCLRLLYEPATLRCGHSFCKSCCKELYSQNHAKCPMCRTLLPIVHGNQAISTSFTLCKILEGGFPQEYQQRRAEEERLRRSLIANSDDTSKANELPLFYLDPMLPRQQMQLNIFEPRYILMVTRCLEGSRRFGMVGGPRYGVVGDTKHGVEVEITESEVQRPSGRILIRIQARRRFVMEGDTERLDGYSVANVRWLDLPTSPVSLNTAVAGEEDEEDEAQNSEEQIVKLAKDLEPLVNDWKSKVVSGRWQRYGGQLASILQDIGPMPEVEDCASAVDRALWIGALINPLPGLGVALEIRPDLLANAQNPRVCLDVATAGIRRSIENMTPDPTIVWLEYKMNRIFGRRTLEELGPLPPPPSPFVIIKVLMKLFLLMTAVSFLLSQSSDDEEDVLGGEEL